MNNSRPVHRLRHRGRQKSEHKPIRVKIICEYVEPKEESDSVLIEAVKRAKRESEECATELNMKMTKWDIEKQCIFDEYPDGRKVYYER